jgi:hypothetical protein
LWFGGAVVAVGRREEVEVGVGAWRCCDGRWLLAVVDFGRHCMTASSVRIKRKITIFAIVTDRNGDGGEESQRIR